MIVYNVDLVFNSCIEPNLHATEKYQIARETYANLSHVIMIRRNCDMVMKGRETSICIDFCNIYSALTANFSHLYRSISPNIGESFLPFFFQI